MVPVHKMFVEADLASGSWPRTGTMKVEVEGGIGIGNRASDYFVKVATSQRIPPGVKSTTRICYSSLSVVRP